METPMLSTRATYNRDTAAHAATLILAAACAVTAVLCLLVAHGSI